MNNLESFDENKRKCYGCKKYFEKKYTKIDAVRIDEGFGLGGKYLCISCLKESRVHVDQLFDKHLKQGDSCPDEFITFMEKYCEIQKKSIEDLKNE
jgi:hypothetical protein